jgi:hypothetical protein
VDWSLVSDRISLGGKPDEDGIRGLIRYGHTHVLDLRHTTKDFDLYALNFTYLRLPTIDDGNSKSPGWFHRGIHFAMEAFLYPSGRLYVGCHQGLHRAPSMVAAILMSMGYGCTEAINLILEKRPDISYKYMADAIAAVKEI